MSMIYLALGSNLGDRKQNILKAIELLKKKVKNISVAGFYETKPQYYEKQDIFLNTVLRGETDLPPSELLRFVKKIEREIGRKPRIRYGPREIDIDILFYDNLVYKDKILIIPHPLLQERYFVLRPFLDLDAEFVHPVLKKTIGALYKIL